MSKISDLKEPVLERIWFFKQAGTLRDVRNSARELSRALHELELELKKLEV